MKGMVSKIKYVCVCVCLVINRFRAMEMESLYDYYYNFHLAGFSVNDDRAEWLACVFRHRGCLVFYMTVAACFD